MPADKPSAAARPFDAGLVEHLIGLMARHDLSEIDLFEGEHRIRLRRGGKPVVAAPAPAPPVSHAPAQPAAPVAPPAVVSAPAAGRKLHEIKSPMVGTFYARPKPDAEPYVKVGSAVRPDTVVCKLEAMKIFNDLTADCTGTVAEVCVQDKQPVDFDTVLFRVEPS